MLIRSKWLYTGLSRSIAAAMSAATTSTSAGAPPAPSRERKLSERGGRMLSLVTAGKSGDLLVSGCRRLVDLRATRESDPLR